MKELFLKTSAILIAIATISFILFDVSVEAVVLGIGFALLLPGVVILDDILTDW